MDAAQPNTSVSEPGVSEVNTASNHKRDESSTGTKAAENPGKSNAKKDVKTLAVGLKTNHPPISDTVLESIKSIKTRKGASVKVILQYIEGHYKVSAKYTKPSIKRFLETGVEKSILEHVSGEGPDGRFKIKKPEAPKKDKRNAKQNQKKTGTQKRNLEDGKKGRPLGKIKLFKQQRVKKNENLSLNQVKG